jgi:hypothetical protein
MVLIKAKLKTCSKCLKQRPLFLGKPHNLCYYCAKNSSIKKPKDKYSERQELDKWFQEQINIMPKYCEESGNYLNAYAAWGAKACIAHICAKRNIKSVATHPNNRMFYDIDVHTNFDNATSDEIKQMKSYPLIVARFNTFKHEILPSEYRYLPDYLLELMD